jgi:hypothetical protein
MERIKNFSTYKSAPNTLYIVDFDNTLYRSNNPFGTPEGLTVLKAVFGGMWLGKWRTCVGDMTISCQELLKFLKNENFIIVTSRDKTIKDETEKILLQDFTTPLPKVVYCGGSKIKTILDIAKTNKGEEIIVIDDLIVDFAPLMKAGIKVISYACPNFADFTISPTELKATTNDGKVFTVPKTRIIAFRGGKFGSCGSAKDTAGELAKILLNRGDTKVVIKKFATGVKIISSLITRLSLDDQYNNKDKIFTRPNDGFDYFTLIKRALIKMVDIKLSEFDISDFVKSLPLETPMSLAEWQVEIGMKVRKHIHNNFWIMALEKSLEKDKINIITDLRFKNENKWLEKAHGSLIIAIERSLELREPYLHGRDPNDPSEIDLNDVQAMFTVTNNGELSELLVQLEKILL